MLYQMTLNSRRHVSASERNSKLICVSFSTFVLDFLAVCNIFMFDFCSTWFDVAAEPLQGEPYLISSAADDDDNDWQKIVR